MKPAAAPLPKTRRPTSSACSRGSSITCWPRSAVPQPASAALFVALLISYHARTVWLMQRTFGKAVFGLRVCCVSGSDLVADSLM